MHTTNTGRAFEQRYLYENYQYCSCTLLDIRYTAGSGQREPPRPAGSHAWEAEVPPNFKVLKVPRSFPGTAARKVEVPSLLAQVWGGSLWSDPAVIQAVQASHI